jgi:hypothetical protein
MPRTSYEFDHSRNVCRCGLDLPPAAVWTEFTVAWHRYHHTLWEHTARTVRGTKPTLAQARELIGRAGAYIEALEAEARTLRVEIGELRDELAERRGPVAS